MTAIATLGFSPGSIANVVLLGFGAVGSASTGTWTEIPPQSGTWSPISAQTGTWMPISPESGTWSEI